MTTYVLVGGAWLGGWAWQPVTGQLRERGHDVQPVTLTGLGDRSHLATPETDLEPTPARELIERLVDQAGDGWRIPMPAWEDLEGVMGASLEGLGPDERASMRARAVAQPVRTWTQPLALKNPARGQLPKAMISCSIPLAQVQEMIAAGHPWFAELAGPQWSLLELPTGHWPMFSVPGPLAALLHNLPVR